MMNTGPLSGLRVALRASGVPAAYAARLLGTMGASGHSARRARRIAASARTALPAGRDIGPVRLSRGGLRRPHRCRARNARIRRGAERERHFHRRYAAGRARRWGWTRRAIARAHPQLVHVSVLPFGAHGPKAGWRGEDITVLHASGEGYLLPNGLTNEHVS
jgi:crotonobetainyl-CoA:carnitine CoA-transferase CaiB-like acyl-CoA transferase